MTTLLNDAGNTRLKWRLLDDARRVVNAGAVETHGDWAALRALKPESVWIANVAGDAITQALQATFANTIVLASRAAACGVTNHYQPPQSLGVDRFLALIAAHHGNIAAPKIVVMAGTALTIDALMPDGQFIGGMIAPGHRLMRASLNANTANLPLVTEVADDNHGGLFARNTTDAIAQGTRQAQVGAIMQAVATLASVSGKAPVILLSGGAAGSLQSALQSALQATTTDTRLTIKMIDNLVLDGLAVFAHSNSPADNE